MSLKELENLPKDTQFSFEELLTKIKTNDQGLIPAIAQQYDTGEVLMLAYMNEASIRETLATQQVCYWSRSRQSYWRKGESSGHIQKLISMSFDCDGDCILLKVDQLGAACHTNRRNCFFFEIKDQQVLINSAPIK